MKAVTRPSPLRRQLQPRGNFSPVLEMLEDRRMLNVAPVAIDDNYGIFTGSELSIGSPGVLGNDLDADGDTLTATLDSDPEHGMLTLQMDGSFQYVPQQGFSGRDSFTYRAGDGSKSSDPARVFIHVVPTGQMELPLAVNDTYTVSFADALSVPVAEGVLANDTIPDEGELEVSLVIPPQFGTLRFNATGSFQYIPRGEFHEEDEFQYQISDGVNPPSTATVTIELTPATFEFLEWPRELGGNGHSYALINQPTSWESALAMATEFTLRGQNGYLATLSTEAEYNWFVENFPQRTVSLGGFQDLSAPDFSEPAGGWRWITGEPWEFTAWFPGEPNDLNGEEALQWFGPGWNDIARDAGNPSFVVEFDPGAPPSLIAVDDEYSVSIGGELVVAAENGFLVNDFDPFGERLTVVLLESPKNGTLELDEQGAFSYRPNAGFDGADSFTYLVQNESGNIDSATVVLLVGADNHAPIAHEDQYEIAEDNVLEVSAENGVLANDEDMDGDLLTAGIVQQPRHGTLTFQPDGSFRYEPAENFFGSDEFTYRATDGRAFQAESDVTKVTIQIAAINDPPVAVDDHYQISIGQRLDELSPRLSINRVTIPANDLQYDPHRDVIYVSVASSVSYGNSIAALDPETGEILRTVFVGSNPNRMALADDGSYLYVGLNGAQTVRRVDLETFTAGPQISLVDAVAADIAVLPGMPTSIAVARKDGSTPRDTVIYDNGVPRPESWEIGSEIEFNADGTAIIGYRPEFSDRALFRYDVTPAGLVNGFERSFYVRAVKDMTWDDGWLFLGSGEVVSDESLLLVGTYQITDQRHVLPAGDRVFHLRNDQLSIFDRDRFVLLEKITIPGVNQGDDFIRVGTDGVAFRQGATVVIVHGDKLTATEHLGVLRNDTDIENEPLTAELVTSPEHGNLTFHPDGSFAYQPNAGFFGIDRFQYRAHDASAPSNLATVEIMVGDPITIPVARDDSYAVPENGFLDTRGRPTFEFMELPGIASDVIFDPIRNQLYATVPGTEPDGNSIVVIDPVTGDLGPRLFVGSNPNQLALADDGVTLYVGLEGARAIARVDLSSFTVVETFSLGDDPAEDIAVRPGHPDTIAVSYLSPGGAADGVTLFVDGVKQTRQGSIADTLAFSADGNTLYAQLNVAVPRTLTAYSIEADGLHKGVEFQEEIRSVNQILWVDGLIYRDDGLVLDAATLMPVGDFSTEGSVLPLVEADRVLFLRADSILVGHEETRVELATAAIPATVRNGRGLQSVGDSTFAYLDGDQNVVLMRAENLDGSQSFTILDNDFIPVEGAWKPELVQNVSHGNVELADDGSFVYTPTPDFRGIDYFTYVVTGLGDTSEPVVVILRVGGAEVLPGDVNLDSTVDLTDFALLKAGFGSGDSLLEGDANGDGRVDLLDFNAIKSNFGRQSTSPQVGQLGSGASAQSLNANRATASFWMSTEEGIVHSRALSTSLADFSRACDVVMDLLADDVLQTVDEATSLE